MRSKGNSVFALIGTGIFVAVLLTISLQALYQDEQFEKKGLRSQGTVEHEWTNSGSKGGIHYHVRFHFPDAHGSVWVVSNDTSPGTYQSVQVGTVVPVKYLGADPNQCRIDLPNETAFQWHRDKVLFYLALGLAAFCGLIFWGNRRR